MRPTVIILVLTALCLAAVGHAEEAPPAPAQIDPRVAEERARTAFEKAPDSVWLGLLLLEQQVRGGKMNDAVALADNLVKRFPKDPQVWAQRGYLMFTRGNFDQAMIDFTHALKFDIWTTEQHRNLRLALADSALAAGQPLGALAALEPLGEGKDSAVLLRLAKARLATGNRSGAADAARLANQLATSQTEREEAELLLESAVAPIAEAVDNGGFKQLESGYKALRQHDDTAGFAAFQKGFALGSGTAAHYADAAYAAKRLSNNAMAIRYFKRSLTMNEAEQTFAPPRTLGFRREIEVMERKFGFSLGTPYQAGGLDVLQGGFEAYWQPPVIGYRNGRTVQLLARGFQNFRNGEYGLTGLQTAQGSVGGRYKPFTARNLVFTVERLVPLGQKALSDWLLRIGYSTGAGTDLSIAKPRWPSWQVYGEAAYFVQAERLLVSSEARYGMIWAIPNGSRLTLSGYPVIAADYDNDGEPKFAFAAGAGLALRQWFREGRFSAPASWFDLTVQYRLAYADRARGLLVRAQVSF